MQCTDSTPELKTEESPIQAVAMSTFRHSDCFYLAFRRSRVLQIRVVAPKQKITKETEKNINDYDKKVLDKGKGFKYIVPIKTIIIKRVKWVL